MLDDVTGRQLSPIFVGRETETTMLESRLADARNGQASVVLVGGEAGVGKTRLVEEFSGTATSAGARVLLGGCFDLGDDALAFAPFSAALREPMRTNGVTEFVELAGGAGADRRRLYEAVTDLLEDLGSDNPLVLILEDLHWADRSTRELLAFLARTLHDSAVLVVGTFRSDELHRAHPLRPFLAELDRVRSVERIELMRLDRPQVEQQLTGLLERPPTAIELERVFRRSEGNPFFVEELSSCPTISTLPDSLRDLMLVRVERLDRRTQQVLRNAAIIGVTVPHALLSVVLDETEEELTTALREAVGSNLLVTHSDDDSYVFRHSLLR
ncbi:MAG TPA: AAA family ATPase, partial [Actinomycetes bacterium]|nr:AAA family ATPase [Actinomycetes bacterium]